MVINDCIRIEFKEFSAARIIHEDLIIAIGHQTRGIIFSFEREVEIKQFGAYLVWLGKGVGIACFFLEGAKLKIRSTLFH